MAGWWAAYISASVGGAGDVTYDCKLSPDLTDREQSQQYVDKIWSLDTAAGYGSAPEAGEIMIDTGMRAGAVGSESALLHFGWGVSQAYAIDSRYTYGFRGYTTAAVPWGNKQVLPVVWVPNGKLSTWDPKNFHIRYVHKHASASSITLALIGRWGYKQYGLPHIDGSGDPEQTRSFIP